MVLYALNAVLFITQIKIRYNRNRNPLENEDPSKTKTPRKRRLPRDYIREKKDDRSHNASLGRVLVVLNRPHDQLNLVEKISMKYKKISYRSRHNTKSCQGLTKTKILGNEARRQKTHSKTKTH